MGVKKRMEKMEFIGRIIANAYYDFQNTRISAMNQIRDVIRKTSEGIEFNEVEEKKEKKDYKKKYTDNELLSKWNQLLIDGEITQKSYDYLLECWKMVKETKNLEGKYKRAMLKFVKDVPIYKEWLSKIRGIGPVLSANLIKEFGDCSQYGTVSKLWAYTGNHVVDGIAPKREKGKRLSYSPRLRTLTWKLSDSLLKQNKGFYRKIYDDEKKKQLRKTYELGYLHEKYPQKRKSGKDIYPESATTLILGHAHNRALRKMRKIFLAHYWHVARELAGLKTEQTYVEGVLGHDHIVSWEEALTRENELIQPVIT